MVKRQLNLIIIFVLLKSSAFCQEYSTDYAIYSSVISNTMSKDAVSVVISYQTDKDEDNQRNFDTTNQTSIYSWWWSCHTPFDSTSYSLIAKYYFSTKQSKVLKDSFQLPVKRFLIDDATFLKFFRRRNTVISGWNKFYKRYPKSAGFYKFSDIIYSADKRKAVLYFSFQRDGLNGTGAIAVLENNSGIWTVLQQCSIWHN